MIEVWKETLVPGAQVDPKTRRAFTVTDKDVRAARRNINRMVKKGLNIPSVWEHQDVEEADDEDWKANYARNTFGHVGGARLNDRGALDVLYVVHTDADADQLKKTRFVSPKIYKGYLDSTGEEYEGTTVAHVAATPTPVQFWQRPFELSETDVLYLSVAPPEPDPEEVISCLPDDWDYDEWLASLDAEVGADDPLALSATEDEPEEDEPVADEPEKKDPPKSKEGGDKGGDKDGDKGGGERNADLDAVIKAIKGAYPAAKISDKVTNWSELVIALESQAGPAEEPEPEPEPEPTPDEGTGETAPGGAPPMLMSTTDRDPTKRKQALGWARDERGELAKRVNAALKGNGAKARNPQEGRRLLRQVETVELSTFADGVPTGTRWTALVAAVDAYENSEPTVALRTDGTAVHMSATLRERPNLAGTPGVPSAERGALGAEIILGTKSVKDA